MLAKGRMNFGSPLKVTGHVSETVPTYRRASKGGADGGRRSVFDKSILNELPSQTFESVTAKAMQRTSIAEISTG